jgi:uncharacterized Fe-S cluster protein YjdI
MSEINPTKKEYTNGEVTIVWQPKLCIHSANCVNGLPGVFNTKAKPWINAEGASTEEIIAQIKQCPSGALQYYLNEEDQKSHNDMDKGETFEVEALKDGPLMVKGKVKVKKANGEEETREKATAFCRCGASSNKPYCDGSHRKVDFKD